MHPRSERVLVAGCTQRMRRTPGMHGGCGVCGVHVQVGSGLQRSGECLRECIAARDVHDGRAGMRLSIGNDALHERRVQCGGVLHERMLERGDAVSNG